MVEENKIKRILVVSHAMELGGAERALLGLLENFDYSKYQIDLFLMRHTGELLQYIPDDVHLLPQVPAYTVLARPMKETLKEGHILLTAARFVGKMKAARFDKKHSYQDSGVSLEYSHKYTCSLMPKIQPDIEYDFAISFLTPHYFVAEKVRAKKKIAWIHTDYSHVQVDVQSETAMWSKYDYIATISEAVSASFTGVFPGLQNKLVLIENILPKKLILQQAGESDGSDEMPADGSVRLLSVGRFTYAKNFDNVPDICAKLCAMGLPVKWYLIGYGGEESMIRQRIQEAHMEDHVIILGKKDNPYPFIQSCDLYVQPSRYEGKCVAVREAQMLGKPVIITDYATSSSQLENGVDGIVVPMDNQGCAQGIAKIIGDIPLQQTLVRNSWQRDYTNAVEIQKLERLEK